MTNDAPKLLPCPFCGGKNVRAGHGVRYADCLNCDSMGPTARYPDNAISAWNTRADHAQAELQAAVAAEREKCAKVADEWCSLMEELGRKRPEDSDDRARYFARAWSAIYIAQDIRARTYPDAQAALEAVKREARNDALREAARMVDCACANKAKVAALPAKNSGERWRLCGAEPCGAIEAADILALIEENNDE